MADDDVAELQAKLEQAERQLALFDPAAVAAYGDQRAREAAAKAESALAAAQGAWKALRANILVSDGADKVMRGVWFRGGDAVAQVHAVDAALAAESGKPGGEARTGNKRHRCMRCRVEFDCRTAGCEAKYDVLPRIVQRAPDGSIEVVEHECGKTAAEPRAAPPALPAELSGKGEQRLRLCLLDFLWNHKGSDCAGRGECVCDDAWDALGLRWGDTEAARSALKSAREPGGAKEEGT